MRSGVHNLVLSARRDFDEARDFAVASLAAREQQVLDPGAAALAARIPGPASPEDADAAHPAPAPGGPVNGDQVRCKGAARNIPLTCMIFRVTTVTITVLLLLLFGLGLSGRDRSVAWAQSPATRRAGCRPTPRRATGEPPVLGIDLGTTNSVAASIEARAGS